MTRYFLAFVGIAYLALALWCIARPGQTSDSVGLTLKPGSGQSEYMVVYGGMQVALGLLFLWPLRNPAIEPTVLISCVVLHGILVGFRTLSLSLFSGIQPVTYWLAGVEWSIFLGSLGCYIVFRKTGP